VNHPVVHKRVERCVGSHPSYDRPDRENQVPDDQRRHVPRGPLRLVRFRGDAKEVGGALTGKDTLPK